MEVTQNIKLNINDTGNYYVVTVKQGDTGRKLNVTMTDGQEELTIPSSATVSVRVLKSDGTSVDDTATVSGGKAIVTLTEQMTAVAGYAKADVSVASSGKIVSTATFLLKVGEMPLGVEIVSENEFTQLSDLIASASQYESRIGDLEETLLTLSWTSGAYIATDGTITSNNVWYYTEQYYPIKAIESIYIPLWHLASCIAYYDADKTFVGYNEGTGKYTETSEAKTSFDSIVNAVYVRFCTETRSINDFELTLITPYDAFVQTHPLYGKKVAVIGDSMVKGDYVNASQVWLTLLSQKTGAITYNYGQNGVNITNHDHNSKHGICITYADMADGMDYVIVFGGTNDAYRGFALGDTGSTDDLTFNGALNELLDGLLTKYPTAKIGFISPYKNAYTNRNGNFNDYYNAIVDRCNERGIPVYDNVRGGGIGWDNSARTAVLTKGDNCHLSPEGHAFVVDRYIEFIQSMDNSGQSTTEIDNKASIIEDSATGTIANFTDGANLPVAELIVDIEPIQSGSGDPSPTNVRAISGRTSVKVNRTGKNLLPYPFYHNTRTVNGVTFTNNLDGTVTANGTATSTANQHLVSATNSNFTLPIGSYIVTGCPTGGSSSSYQIYVEKRVNGTTTYVTRDVGNGATFTVDSAEATYGIMVRIPAGVTVDNLTFHPMLRLASDTDSTWASPVDNETTSISLGQTVYGGTLNVATGVLTMTHVSKLISDADSTVINSSTASDGSTILNVYYGGGSKKAVGRDNIISSQYATKDVAVASLKTGEVCGHATGNSSYFADSRFNGKTKDEILALIGSVQVVYELATSVTYQLTANEVQTLLGENNIWADSGDVEVTYRADTKLYIDKKLGA